MPRKAKTTYELADDGAGGLSPVAVGGHSRGFSGLLGLQESTSRAEAASAAFQWLISRHDGWLRVGGGNTDKHNYFKFKYAAGQHRGKYVMYVAPVGAWVEGVLGLAEKVYEVDLGTRRPSVDTFYDNWE